MDKIKTSEDVDRSRRRLLGAAAGTFAAAQGLALLGPHPHAGASRPRGHQIMVDRRARDGVAQTGGGDDAALIAEITTRLRRNPAAAGLQRTSAPGA